MTDNSSTDTPAAAARKEAWTSEGSSIALALITLFIVVAWAVTTGTRTILTNEVVEPKWWFTAAIPVWAALIIFALQIWFLADSILYSTSKEAAGTRDVDVSQWTFTGIVLISVVWVLLWGLFKIGISTFNMPLSFNHMQGLAAFLITAFVESRATNKAWTVANRRPGGTIGI